MTTDPKAHRQPVLFIAHGAPDVLLQQDPVIDDWRQACSGLTGVERILVISAHWTTDDFKVGGNRHRKTIHDFHGFPRQLHEMRYEPPSDREWADELAGRLGLATDHQRGLDHGAWVPLLACSPDAEIPVTQLSVAPGRSFDAHYRLGQKLATLREQGVLVLASGVIVHNLARVDLQQPRGLQPEGWADGFMTGIQAAIESGDHATLRQPMALPGAALAVPTTEHYLPLLVAAGAAGDAPVRRFADVWRYRNLSQHSYRWD